MGSRYLPPVDFLENMIAYVYFMERIAATLKIDMMGYNYDMQYLDSICNYL